jgi:hypothetical protein
VAILLSTYNGEQFLAEQLDSFLTQTHANWMLYWRDDRSADGTVPLLADFAARVGPKVRAGLPCGGHLYVTRSYLTLLAAARDGDADLFAFADQDDVWLPHKLRRGVAALAAVPAGVPALYCSRTVLVDARLRRIALSAPIRRPPGFPTALTQNIATGCTAILNRAAADLVLASKPPSGTLHDWWSYLIVAAAGGRILTDPEAGVLYRQHPGNLIGAPPGLLRRGIAAFRRGPGVFMGIVRQHVAALEAQPHLLSEPARRDLAVIARGLRGGMRERRAALRLPGFVRQTWPEDMVFRLWFMLG